MVSGLKNQNRSKALIHNLWTRRALTLLCLSLLAVSSYGERSAPRGLALYAATDQVLTEYAVDEDRATLSKGASLTLPGAIQYAWPHPSRNILYVAWSNPQSRSYGVSTVQIGTGGLKQIGTALIAARPIHTTVDRLGSHLLVVYNNPSTLTVHPILADGTVGKQIDQHGSFDFGVYAHQVRVEPSGKAVILVTRGNGPSGNRPEDPGALRVFRYDNGLLESLSVTAPARGINFQPRHLDFHPVKPWVYVSLERQNRLQVYELKSDGSLEPEPLFVKNSLAVSAQAAGQAAGTVHIHPSGRFLYQANRASDTHQENGKSVFSGGQNNIAVYSINAATGEPVLIQNADTRGFSPRTFALDPGGRLLVAANQTPMLVSERGILRQVPASLAVFRIKQDGTLTFVRTVETAPGLFYAGIVAWH